MNSVVSDNWKLIRQVSGYVSGIQDVYKLYHSKNEQVYISRTLFPQEYLPNNWSMV